MTDLTGPAWLSTDDAAAVLRCPPEVVDFLCESGNLYGKRQLDGTRRIHRDEVARYLGGSRGVPLRGGAA